MKEHDIVILKNNFADITAGTKGTIAYCYKSASIVEVEFEREGKPNITYSLPEKEFEITVAS